MDQTSLKENNDRLWYGRLMEVAAVEGNVFTGRHLAIFPDTSLAWSVIMCTKGALKGHCFMVVYGKTFTKKQTKKYPNIPYVSVQALDDDDTQYIYHIARFTMYNPLVFIQDIINGIGADV